MRMPARVRKFALVAHVLSSVGWLGAVAAFLALALLGVLSDDAAVVRGVYVVMEPTAWYALVPFAAASLSTGVVMSLGTKWGLFRHYWVVFKLAITALATAILLTYMNTFELMARTAADPTVEIDGVRNASPVLHAALALIGLGIATILAIYKPVGWTRYGRRMRRRSTP